MMIQKVFCTTLKKSKYRFQCYKIQEFKNIDPLLTDVFGGNARLHKIKNVLNKLHDKNILVAISTNGQADEVSEICKKLNIYFDIIHGYTRDRTAKKVIGHLINLNSYIYVQDLTKVIFIKGLREQYLNVPICYADDVNKEKHSFCIIDKTHFIDILREVIGITDEHLNEYNVIF